MVSGLQNFNDVAIRTSKDAPESPPSIAVGD